MTPELVGGHPALDLINTVSWRLDEQRLRDNLADPEALISWCARTELIDERTATALTAAATTDQGEAQLALKATLALREQLTAVLETLLGHSDVETPAWQRSIVLPPDMHAALVDALAHSELAGPPVRWQLKVERASDLSRLLALSALDLLQSTQLHLIRRCAGPGCGWLFLDRTRSHTRRWCDTSDCGNRDRARRHYARQRAKSERT